jgi:hypothetical protein
MVKKGVVKQNGPIATTATVNNSSNTGNTGDNGNISATNALLTKSPFGN